MQKLLGKAGAAWGQAEMHRTEYTTILEEAFEMMGEDERLIQAVAVDEEMAYGDRSRSG